MKARDIIPGWPRGKSTSAPGTCLEQYPLWWIFLQDPSPYDRAMWEDQADSDRRYHEAQQRMVDRWHLQQLRSGIVEPDYLQPGKPFTDVDRLEEWERVIQHERVDALLARLYTTYWMWP